MATTTVHQELVLARQALARANEDVLNLRGQLRTPPSGITRGWQAWRARFGLAELAGTAAAAAGFGGGLALRWPVAAAAALAAITEAVMFYAVVGIRTALAAARATAHLTGPARLAAAAWHAARAQLASAAAAETFDVFLIRPALMTTGALLCRPWIWAGFLLGKAASDLLWYLAEASARAGVSRLAAPPD